MEIAAVVAACNYERGNAMSSCPFIIKNKNSNPKYKNKRITVLFGGPDS